MKWLDNLIEYIRSTPPVAADATPAPPPPKKKLERLRYDDKVFDVGCTTALIIFTDGREVHAKFYGTIDQYVDVGNIFNDKEKERTKIMHPWVCSSVETYKQFMGSVNPNEVVKIVDDCMNPTVAWMGQVNHIELFSTETHEVNFTVASIEEYEE